jgi:hypothetical protein
MLMDVKYCRNSDSVDLGKGVMWRQVVVNNIGAGLDTVTPLNNVTKGTIACSPVALEVYPNAANHGGIVGAKSDSITDKPSS